MHRKIRQRIINKTMCVSSCLNPSLFSKTFFLISSTDTSSYKEEMSTLTKYKLFVKANCILKDETFWLRHITKKTTYYQLKFMLADTYIYET